MEAVVIAEVACLAKLARGYKVIIKLLADLLRQSTKSSSLNGLIDSTFNMTFQGCNDLGLVLPFIGSQGEVLNNIVCLWRNRVGGLVLVKLLVQH